MAERFNPGSARAPVRAVAAGFLFTGATLRAVADQLRQRGWAVAEIDAARASPIGTSLLRRAEWRLRWPYDVAQYNRDVMRLVEETEAQVLITVKGIQLSRSTIEKCRQRGVVTVNYWPDYFPPPDPRTFFEPYSLVVTTKSYQVDTFREWLGRERVELVHHGYSPAIHRRLDVPADDSGFDYDISYVGTATPNKVELMTKVVEKFPDRRIRIFGGAWKKFARGTPLSQVIAGNPLTTDFMALQVGRSRVNIAVHMGIDPGTGWQDFVSTRTFEIPACGGFMLHIDNAEVRSMYDVPGEIDVFNSIDELNEKIAHYLDHPAERMAMAARAHDRAVPAYSYWERADEIAAFVEARL